MVFQPVHVAGKQLQRTFDHLLNTAKRRAGQGVPTRVSSPPKFVQPKDRIALWNISHGDRVMVRSGKHKGKFGTVDYVDRQHNRVYLVEPEFGITKPVPAAKKNEVYKNPDFVPGQTVHRATPIHYSNLALAMRRSPEDEAIAVEQRRSSSHEAGAIAADTPLPEVVATRLKSTGVHYDWKRRRWSWKRVAENVVEIDPTTNYTTALDWAKKQRTMGFIRKVNPLPKSPSPLDTSPSQASESTFVPPLDPLSDVPPELKIRGMEFSTPNSRAKRTRKFNEKRMLADVTVASELQV